MATDTLFIAVNGLCNGSIDDLEIVALFTDYAFLERLNNANIDEITRV